MANEISGTEGGQEKETWTYLPDSSDEESAAHDAQPSSKPSSAHDGTDETATDSEPDSAFLSDSTTTARTTPPKYHLWSRDAAYTELRRREFMVGLHKRGVPVKHDAKDASMDTGYACNVSADTSFSGDKYNDDSDSNEADDVTDEMLQARVAKNAQIIREQSIPSTAFSRGWKKD
ncbi:hypothetical protein SARC_09792 [Sphaeroforma arctica JP610]|uniref:Uncharacterized protein n=1 Tax=Sphaeroforma arctica JP610 TaxID=667725 RepID=A0A0L0FMM3_9EUKA|nr:hypothetical protein SARC_09792 [Sphaeroforma arctica JP610]KNC77756.1 hypothetical protein SARC_09792 [Sphaeroforma arctica JP610]|eukprot:XP_014151658.1 hypothetical protein SARC_09792 [Sphaeroforma arctica JP610]